MVPCPVCVGTGYLGQVGVFEVLVLDDEARRMLAANDLKGVLAYARRNKMILLQEAALAKVINGETTIEELVRVLTARPAGEAPSATPASAGAQPQPAA
jgi:type II secretory ATPase GspE/PulE/Tfp pilus assembly ATPase PilB-like protein